ncbi:YbaB/EbfC family nucleoid-associated protein [Micromonospora sp. Llam7]|uniref:YbaB/EbfC family nucleoid-associated protein n=1 Tax=Micromonospora tarapacensis TaxID=2835305 RepID=UPI001C82E410|nr:YbaB/EbfC family nucleoid-associated protein [Micromonospora tarapacensis]MBX7266400.1 YbaB/EbfC family nucleoid-associated protein [Micromonospora tarapacensis]
MTGPLHNRVEQAFAELQSTQAAIVGAQQVLAGTSASVTTRNRALTVTVDAQSRVTEITFHSGAYRSLAPAELGALLVEAISEAQGEVVSKTMGMFQSLLPAGARLESLLAGSFDPDEMVGEALRAAQTPLPGEPGFRKQTTNPNSTEDHDE